MGMTPADGGGCRHRMPCATSQTGSSPISAIFVKAREVSAIIEVTALPLSPPARRIIAKDPDLASRLASASDKYELAFASPPDVSPAIERRSPELPRRSPQPPLSREKKAGVRLVDPARSKRLPATASGWE